MPDLYDAVAHGMRAYSAAAFRVDVLGPRRFPLEPGTLVVITHRRETDVPIVAPALYFGTGGLRNRANRLHFAARDDMFLPGFFAGFPPSLPLRVRRALYPIGVARWLPVVNVFPIRSASVARLGEVLAARPEAPLEELVPDDGLTRLLARATATGRPAPARARDVLRGEYADLLWEAVSPGDGVRDGLDDFWGRRAAGAAGDFRTLVELVRARRTLLVFPEGAPPPPGRSARSDQGSAPSSGAASRSPCGRSRSPTTHWVAAARGSTSPSGRRCPRRGRRRSRRCSASCARRCP